MSTCSEAAPQNTESQRALVCLLASPVQKSAKTRIAGCDVARVAQLIEGAISLFRRLRVKTNGTILGWCTPPILLYFSGDWDVHWGYGILIHGQVFVVILMHGCRLATKPVGYWAVPAFRRLERRPAAMLSLNVARNV